MSTQKKNTLLEQEKNELNTLIGKGIDFELDDVVFEVKKRFLGLPIKREKKIIKRKFKIDEPTLGTLDRLSAEWIEFDIDEELMKQNNDAMQRAKTLVRNHNKRCAKIIALAVLGSDYLIPKQSINGMVKYKEDNKCLNELTALFHRTVKPSKLYELCILINAMCNFGDFMNSIRLMSAERTTMPIRIEENTKG